MDTCPLAHANSQITIRMAIRMKRGAALPNARAFVFAWRFECVSCLSGGARVLALFCFVLALFCFVLAETGGNGVFLWGGIIFPSVKNLGRKNSSR